MSLIKKVESITKLTNRDNCRIKRYIKKLKKYKKIN